MIGLDTSALIAMEMSDHPAHGQVTSILAAARLASEMFALTPQVLAEFVHVGTDGRRFAKPFTMESALERAEWWAFADDVSMLEISPDVLRQFFDWMHDHQLGRKRVLDTLLAAAFHVHGVQQIVTLNAGDFAVFGAFQILV